LLDDPLSAVDPSVANGIFTHAIRGALATKCVILVTHQLQFLREAKKILVLKDGQQSMLGTFSEITQQGFDVDEILQQYSNTGKNNENNES